MLASRQGACAADGYLAAVTTEEYPIVYSCTLVPRLELDRTTKPDLCAPRTPKPIFPLTGVERMSVDLGASLAGFPLRWTYNTTRTLPTTNPLPDTRPSEPAAFGRTGFGSLHRAVHYDARSKGARVTRGDGDAVTFAPGAGGTFVADPDVPYRLSREGQGFRFLDARAGSMEYFDGNGRLTSIWRADGQRLDLVYSDIGTATGIAPAPGYLIQATDAFGRSIDFTYELPSGGTPGGDGRVKSATFSGRKVVLNYTDGNLVSIVWPDARVRQFRYERVGLPWALTGIVDENGALHANVAYEDGGRAMSSALAGGVGFHGVAYEQPPTIDASEAYDVARGIVIRSWSWRSPVGTTVTLPNGSAASMEARSMHGLNRLASQMQPAGSGCAASSSAQTHDVNGNVASRDDFNGHRVCFGHLDGRNLERVRVEGLAGGSPGATCSAVLGPDAALPTGTRKISTEWHPDWQFPTRLAEPGRIITLVYNGQPDPYAGGAPASCAPAAALLPDGKPIAVRCRQVEQATSDVDGAAGFSAATQPGVAAREQRWTYNAFGQVLTHDGPRSDVADITGYEYYADAAFTGTDPDIAGHSRGDLMRVTNAAGHATQYTLYNRAGQPLQSVDPNGVVSDFRYDLRGRLIGHGVGGQTTVYAWWPTGLIQRVTTPEGHWTHYEHDAAHRLHRVSDNLGNSISYTLDNLGNRTAETVTDPGGVLRRHVARSIDALGRTELVTGRE